MAVWEIKAALDIEDRRGLLDSTDLLLKEDIQVVQVMTAVLVTQVVLVR